MRSVRGKIILSLSLLIISAGAVLVDALTDFANAGTPYSYTPEPIPYSGNEIWYCSPGFGQDASCTFGNALASGLNGVFGNVNIGGTLAGAGVASLTRISGVPATGQLAAWTSPTAIGGVTPGGDCAFSSPNIVCTKTNGVAFGSLATQTASGVTAGAWQLPTFNAQGVATSGVNNASYQGTAGNCAYSNVTGVMCGYGATASITPTGTRRVLFIVSGYVSSLDGGLTCTLNLRYGTGAAPAAGAALAGTVISISAISNGFAATEFYAYALTAIVSGLSGGPYWIDLSNQDSSSSFACTIVAPNISAIEL
jgi:hypothetical protein